MNDIIQFITAVAALLGALTAAASLLASLRNALKIKEIHLSINSRFDQFLALTKHAAVAEGRKLEKDEMEASIRKAPAPLDP
jgi:hypothetical protein